jgi:hypothetical protein
MLCLVSIHSRSSLRRTQLDTMQADLWKGRGASPSHQVIMTSLSISVEQPCKKDLGADAHPPNLKGFKRKLIISFPRTLNDRISDSLCINLYKTTCTIVPVCDYNLQCILNLSAITCGFASMHSYSVTVIIPAIACSVG